MKNYGYKLDVLQFTDTIVVYSYSKDNINTDISFLTSNINYDLIVHCKLKMPELKAINEKVKELGWEE